jgi:hypothetical protein
MNIWLLNQVVCTLLSLKGETNINISVLFITKIWILSWLRHTFSSVLLKHQNREDVWKSGGTAPWILRLGTRQRRTVSFTAQDALSRVPREETRYQRERRQAAPLWWSDCGGGKKKIPIPAQNRTPVVHPITSPFIKFSYPVSKYFELRQKI